jgi:hypothetical protein
MDESQKCYCPQKKPDAKDHIVCDPNYVICPIKGKYLKTESRS